MRFQRHEVIYNDKKSVVIHVRDLTEQEGIFEAEEKIMLQHQAVSKLSNELVALLQSIDSAM